MGGLTPAQKAAKKRTREGGEFTSPSSSVNVVPFSDFQDLFENGDDKFVACDDFCQTSSCTNATDSDDED